MNVSGVVANEMGNGTTNSNRVAIQKQKAILTELMTSFRLNTGANMTIPIKRAKIRKKMTI